MSTYFESDAVAAEFAERVRSNQVKLTSELKSHYDFIVCGSGSSGSVVARRLAENPDVSVLLLEAGGDDVVPSVMEANQWPMNLGSERDWSFQGEPNPRVNGRSIPFSMGKVLGGGSSINVMVWARGHKSDWDFFASEAGDPAWSYESVLNIYRRIEDWHGAPDPKYRGTGGPVFVEPAPEPNPLAPATVAIFFWKSKSGLLSPDLFACQAEVPKSSVENAARFGLPAAGWTLFGAVAHPKSRGHLRLTGPNPLDPIQIEANTLCHPDDLKAAIACVELCREIGNSAPLRPFVKREVMPGNLKGAELENFIRDAATSYWHETCTAKMGRDPMSVVDGNLKVYGIENLRIADGSIMPRVTTGNTMAPCVVIGERAAETLKAKHKL
jgi:choline dehydrogenase-like flavoprotein